MIRSLGEVLHVGCGRAYDEEPIFMQMGAMTSYDSKLNEWFSIADAEMLIKLLQKAIDKAKLLKKDDSDNGEDD